MKFLQEYIEAEQTKVFKKYGSFFAFSKKQFEEQKKDGIKYVSLNNGMIVPVKNAKELTEELKLIYENGIKKDIEENGISAIIQRELGNHEAQITMDIADTVEALEGYSIKEELIRKEYKIYLTACIEHDLF